MFCSWWFLILFESLDLFSDVWIRNVYVCVWDRNTEEEHHVCSRTVCVCVCVFVCLRPPLIHLWQRHPLPNPHNPLCWRSYHLKQTQATTPLSPRVCVCVCVFMVYLQGISREFLITSVLCLLAHWKGHKYTLPADIILTHTHTHTHTLSATPMGQLLLTHIKSPEVLTEKCLSSQSRSLWSRDYNWCFPGQFSHTHTHTHTRTHTHTDLEETDSVEMCLQVV